MTEFRLAPVRDGRAHWATATPVTVPEGEPQQPDTTPEQPVAMPRLTPKQHVVYACLRAYISVHGYPPMLGQLADELGLASRSTVAYHLDGLQAKGLVQRDGHVIRGVRLAQGRWGHARSELHPVAGGAR